MDKMEYERAWNAAIEEVDKITSQWYTRDQWIYPLKAPSAAFDEWYEREVANPPEGWDDHHDT